MFWKPILVAALVLTVLITLSYPFVWRMAVDAAARHDATVPTMYIPAVWRAALTQAALTPTATPMPLP